MKNSSAAWLKSTSSIPFLVLAFSFTVLAGQEVNSIVAKVGDRTVTAQDLDRYISPTLKSYVKLMPNDPQIKEEYRKERVEALKGVIDNLLLVKEADKLEIAIPKIEIDKQVAKEKERYATEEEFQAYLKDNKITMEEFRDHLAESFKAQAMLAEKVFKRVRVLPHEIHKFYLDNKDLLYVSQDSVHLYQILVKKDEGESVALSAKDRAKGIVNQLKGGANFQSLALSLSEGPMRDSGGDWGLIEKGHFGEEMAEVERIAFTLEPGQYSAVIESPFGYHIVYVSAKKPAHVQTEREAYEDIYRRLMESKTSTAYEPYMNGLRRATAIEIFDPELAEAKPEIKPGKKIADFYRKDRPQAEPEEKTEEKAQEKSEEKAEEKAGENSGKIEFKETASGEKPEEKAEAKTEEKAEEKAEAKEEEKLAPEEELDKKLDAAALEIPAKSETEETTKALFDMRETKASEEKPEEK